MTWINQPSATLTYRLRDRTGSRATISVNIPHEIPATVALAAGDSLRMHIASLTGCSIESYSLTYTMFDDEPEPPTDGIRVERKGILTLLTASGKTVTYQIPGLHDRAVRGSGQLNGVVIEGLVNAIIAPELPFCDSSGNKIKSLKSAYERYRRST